MRATEVGRKQRVGSKDLRDAQHRTALARSCSTFEEFVAGGHLRVTGILDLDPVRARAIGMVATARELPHDALEVVRTGDLEEAPPACLDVVHVQQSRRHGRDQSAQPALPLAQWPLSQVFAVNAEQIERRSTATQAGRAGS
jgi:hypothetical protein